MAVAADRLHLPRPAPRRRSRARRGSSPAVSVRRVPFGISALCVVAAVIVGLVTAQALVTQDSFRVAELSRRAEALEAEYGMLRLEVAELSSPERIAAAARRAGMVLPEQVEIVRLPAVEPPSERREEAEPGTMALKGVLGGAP